MSCARCQVCQLLWSWFVTESYWLIPIWFAGARARSISFCEWYFMKNESNFTKCNPKQLPRPSIWKWTLIFHQGRKKISLGKRLLCAINWMSFHYHGRWVDCYCLGFYNETFALDDWKLLTKMKRKRLAERKGNWTSVIHALKKKVVL